MLHRRNFLNLTAGAALGTGLGLRGSFARSQMDAVPRLLTAMRLEGEDGGALWSREGLKHFALPQRGHALTRIDASGKHLIVGRRPGRYSALIDVSAPDERTLLAPLNSYRYSGHAAANENLLVTAELHAETAMGALVLRDPFSGAITGSWEAGGIEPHELLFADGGARLVAALGGIEQDTDVKGPALNVGEIESAIVELDARTGEVLHRHELTPDYASLSLRHMALAPDGQTIAFGMQDQDFSELRPLMGILRVGRGIDLLELPADDPGALRFYVGSVAIDASAQYIAATSPKGGTVCLWSLSSGVYLGRVAMADVCGLAADAEAARFWVTSGAGDIASLTASETGLAFDARWRAEGQFDNHLLTV
jgi:hypothetical protein